MHVEDAQVSLTGTRFYSFEDELARPWQLQQGEIFRRRPHKNEIVILGVVKRKQAAPLHSNFAMHRAKYPVKFMNGQHLAHSCVVVKNLVARIPDGIEIAHTSLGSADERTVAENHPRLLSILGKSTPKASDRGRSTCTAIGWR